MIQSSDLRGNTDSPTLTWRTIDGRQHQVVLDTNTGQARASTLKTESDGTKLVLVENLKPDKDGFAPVTGPEVNGILPAHPKPTFLTVRPSNRVRRLSCR
jgi:hypothetical protein